MPVSHKWAPIADFAADPGTLTDGELISLARVWRRHKQELAAEGSLEEFEKRLRREWAIETGIIEDVYTLDRGITRTLIEKGIDAALIPHGSSNRDSTLVARIIQDHYDALEGMFDFVGGQRALSVGYIKQLHAALLRNQETYTVVDQFGQAFEKRLEPGVYKLTPNSPTRPDGAVHEYAPPEHTAAEMDRLVALHAEHEQRTVPVEVEAAWLHHRFTQIHPFADGNGRVARAVASLVFIRAGWFPVIVKRDDRARYIEALETADAGDLRPLVAMFVEGQRNALVQASEIASDIWSSRTAEQAIAALRDRLLGADRLGPELWRPAIQIADRLADLAVQRFHEIADDLKREVGSGFVFSANPGGPIPDWALHGAFSKPGLAVDTHSYNTSAYLGLRGPGRLNGALRLSFHAAGPKFHGLIVVAPILEARTTSLLDVGTFQINYEESLESAQARFAPWLERVIVAGLDQWRRTL